MLEYINDGTVNSDKLSKTLDELVKDANKDKRWVSGVWKGLTREENWAIDRQIYQNKIDDAQATRIAAESAREAEAEAARKAKLNSPTLF